jgi:four helix bundle protein
MAMVKHYRELRVYQRAFEAAMQIFELSKSWPREEKFSLTDQIRRASRSVCSNIAEAWRKRRYVAHFISKLSDSDAEAAETQVWLDFALRCGYMTEEARRKLYDEYEAIGAGLVNMMSSAEEWCGPSTLVREEPAEYFVGEE